MPPCPPRSPLFALLIALFCAGGGCRHDPKETGSTTAGIALAISDSGHGRVVFTNATRSERTGESCLRELIPDECPAEPGGGGGAADTADTGGSTFARCLTFGVRHEGSAGDDVLEVTYARYLDGQDNLPGAISRYTPTHPPQVAWSFDTLVFPAGALAGTCTGPSALPECGLRMPHASIAAADPAERIIADTLNSRVVWAIPPADAASNLAQGVRLLDPSTPDWGEALYPNNVELHERDGRVYLLVTYKGSDRAVSGNPELGRIMLWDITDPDAPHRVWAFPADGYLAASHGAVVRTVYGEELLLYAHAFGNSASMETPDLGAVGVARMGWDSEPTYLEDLLLDPADGEPFGFVRAVDVLSPGPEGGVLDPDAGGTDRATLLVTDSGCENQDAECALPVGVETIALEPLPEPTGLSGAWSGDHAEQLLVSARQAAAPYRDALKFPFQALPIPEAELGATLTAGAGGCP